MDPALVWPTWQQRPRKIESKGDILAFDILNVHRVLASLPRIHRNMQDGNWQYGQRHS